MFVWVMWKLFGRKPSGCMRRHCTPAAQNILSCRMHSIVLATVSHEEFLPLLFDMTWLLAVGPELQVTMGRDSVTTNLVSLIALYRRWCALAAVTAILLRRSSWSNVLNNYAQSSLPRYWRERRSLRIGSLQRNAPPTQTLRVVWYAGICHGAARHTNSR